MSGVDSVNASLYFAATANAAQEAAKETQKKKQSATVKRRSFADVVRQNKDAEELAAAGIPPEVAALPKEEAVALLKDALDAAGDRLTVEMSADAFSNYRTAVHRFTKYIVKYNFTIEKFNRAGINRRTGKKRDPLVQVRVIDHKLDQLASDMVRNHMGKLQLLARVQEIQGLLVDLLAA